MKTIAGAVSCSLLLLAAQAPAADDRRAGFERFGPAYQFVFFSVLEGLYQDGATQADVDRVLMRRSPEHGLEHFIYSCPICTAVQLAIELYGQRPDYSMYKAQSHPDHAFDHTTFGAGFAHDVLNGLNSDDVTLRLRTVHGLVTEWIERRMTAMNLTAPQRKTLLDEIAIGRKRGMIALDKFKKDPARLQRRAPGYATFKGCALCNAACQIDFADILETSN